MKLTEAVGLFEQHLTANGYSRHTVRAYRCDLEGLIRFCQGRSIGSGRA